MKYIFYSLIVLFTCSSCIKQEPIAREQLTGIWKLNAYQSTSYTMEITKDNYFYWFNYNDDPHYTREFEMEYNMDRNMIYLYNPGRRTVIHYFKIYKDSRGRYYFSVTNSFGLDAQGNAVTRTDTYYLM